MKKTLLLLSILALGFYACGSDNDDETPTLPLTTTIKVVPGTLDAYLTQYNLKALKELILTGEMDAADFKALGEMEYLESLDMADVKIVASRYYNSLFKEEVNYRADELSHEYMLVLKKTEGDSKAIIVGRYQTLAPKFPALTSIVFPTSITKIGVAALASCKKIKTITVPNNVQELGYSAFEGCESLEEIILPATLSHIEYYAFAKCTSLKTIEIPAGVTELKAHTFLDCTSLRTIEIPEGVTDIDEYVFPGSGLETITFTSPRVSIVPYAFMETDALTAIRVKYLNPLSFRIDVFTPTHYRDVTLYVPAESKSLYEQSIWWGRFKKIVGE